MNLIGLYVTLDPALQTFIGLLITVAVSFLLLQLAKLYPPLADYLGQYKVGITTWLTGGAVQLIQAQLDKLAASKSANAATASTGSATAIAAAKPETSFDDFSKMDIRTATILEAERVPKTDKLLKLKVDTGM